MSDPTYEEIRVEALRIWREREAGFPAFTRRMTPDALDYQSGTWARVFAEAAQRLGWTPPLDASETS